MQYDRQITVSIGNSRKSIDWRPSSMLISEFWDRLKTPIRSKETLSEYMRLKKPVQDDMKDVGGFVGGSLNGTRRKTNAVAGRDLVTLDLDSIPAGETNTVLRRVEALGCGYAVYSTRKHQPAAPRLRILLPLDRTVTAEEYEPIARKMAEYIGLEYIDPTTFDCARLFYWPSCCSDSEYIYMTADKPFTSADGILGAYKDWHDMTQWPSLPGQQSFTKLAVKQGDPLGKNGTVGIFCRVYDIPRAMDELIPGVYEAVDNMPGRYTFLGGSTAGGAVLYDDGKFLYSHHATDPCSGKLVNAFDLVRLHRFGELDIDAKPETPTAKLPSFIAMCEYANSLPDVGAKRAEEDFAGVEGETGAGSNTEWVKQLDISETGGYKKTLNNIKLFMQNAPELHGCVFKNTFSNRIFAADDLPWRSGGGLWTDTDTTELREHFGKRYGFFPNRQDIRDELLAVADKQKTHPVRDYLRALVWDGQPRLDTLFIDYLGVEDTEYSRNVTRKTLVGAVARVMDPGCKFDYMPVFIGAQGRNKSTIISKLAGVQEWFSDSLVSFDGKNAFEAILGKWLIEISEMQAYDRVTMNQAKAFISKQSDFYRPAYAEHPADFPRQCIFFGTTNNPDCLRDETGGRRYWPLDIDAAERKKRVFGDLDNERDQIWAEAVVRWQAGEPLYLSGDIEQAALAKQEEHREASAREGVIREFIERPVPVDWSKWPLDRRMIYWSGGVQGDIETVERDRICAAEIWVEALGGSLRALKTEKREIDAIIAVTPGWRRTRAPVYFGKPYGNARGFTKK